MIVRSLFSAIVLLLNGFAWSCSQREKTEDKIVESAEGPTILLEPSQVTAGNESNFSPAISHDGNWIAYTSDKDVSKNLWRKGLTGGHSKALTSHSADDYSPAISPDSEAIAFVSRRLDALGNIHILRKDSAFAGGGFSLSDDDVVSLPRTEENHPAWYPDGERIIFTARRFSEQEPRIMTADLEDLKAQNLGGIRGEQPSVAPDGSEVVFVRKGSVQVYDEATGEVRKLTPGGSVRDGQPRFSKAGDRIVHIRYADDTNEDGVLDAEDLPSVWSVPTKLPTAEDKAPGFFSRPLTAAEFAAFSPQIRDDVLLFTRQSPVGLDIFRLPKEGQMPRVTAPEDYERILASVSSYYRRTFILRRMVADFRAMGKGREAASAAYRLLRWLVRNKRNVEARAHFKELATAFKDNDEIISLSKIAMVQLQAGGMLYPEADSDPGPETIARLNDLLTDLRGLEIDKARVGDKVRFEQKLVEAKLLASRRDFVAATKILRETIKRFPGDRELVLQAEFYIAQISAAMIDRETAVRQMAEILKKPKLDAVFSRRVSGRIVEISTESGDTVESLVGIMDQAEGGGVLAALAHLEVAKTYARNKKESVAANEFRQIVTGYPESPDVELAAAHALVEILEKTARLGEVEDLFFNLRDQVAKKSPSYSEKVSALLISVYLKKAALMMRQRAFTEAMEAYLVVRTLDVRNVPAQRGLIQAAFSAGQIESVRKSLREDLEDKPDDPEIIYLNAYADTLDIDTADSAGERVDIIDNAIEDIEEARSINSQNIYIHQSLGWLYFQRHYWTKKYYDSGSFVSGVKSSWKIFVGFFGMREPNWLELAIDSSLSAYFLSQPGSLDRANIAQNLGYAYYANANYTKAIDFFAERIAGLGAAPMAAPRAEGHLLTTAGRCAFHAGKLDLAVSVQKQALALWQRLNDFEMISYSMDALALTYREKGNFSQSGKIYQELYGEQNKAKYRYNAMKAALNAGQMAFVEKDYRRAMEFFDRAEVSLDALKGQKSPDTNDSKEDRSRYRERPQKTKEDSGIKIALSGSSAVYGFDREEHRAIIATYRLRGYEKLGRFNAALSAGKDLIERIKSLKDEKSKTWIAERLALTQNKIGSLYLRTGNHRKAKEAFESAAKNAEMLRPVGHKTPIRAEWVNLVNASRVALRLVQGGVDKKTDLELLSKRISKAVDELFKEESAGGKVDSQAIIRLTSALGMLDSNIASKQSQAQTDAFVERQSKRRIAKARKLEEEKKLREIVRAPDAESGNDLRAEKQGEKELPADARAADEPLPDGQFVEKKAEDDPAIEDPAIEDPAIEDPAGEKKPPASTAEKLLAALELAESEATDTGDLLTPMFAWRGAVGGFKLTDTTEKLAGRFRKDILETKENSWKYYQLNKDAKEAFDRFNKKILVGGMTDSPADKLLYRRQFDALLRKALLKNKKGYRDAYHLLRQFQAYSLLNLLRTQFPRDISEASEKTGSDNSRDNSSNTVDGKAKAKPKPKPKPKPIDHLRRWAAFETRERFAEALGESTAILTAHQSGEGTLYLFVQTAQDLQMVARPVSGTPDAEVLGKTLAELFAKLGDASALTKLYVIPNEEAYFFDWEAVQFEGRSLGSRFSLAFSPQIDFVPKLHELRNPAILLKGFAGTKKQASALEVSGVRLIQKQRWREEFPGFHVVINGHDLQLNQSTLPFFRIDLDSDPRSPDFLAVSPADLVQEDMKGVSVLVFPQMEESRDRLNFRYGGTDGWRLLAVAAAMSGIPSSVIPSANSRSFDPKNLLNEIESKDLGRAIGHSGVKARVLGHHGFSADDKQDLGEELAEELIEDAEDMEEKKSFLKAGRLYGQAYSLLLGLEDEEQANEVLELVRTSYFTGRDFRSTLYFQKILANKAAKSGDDATAASLRMDAASVATRAEAYEEADSLFRSSMKYFEKDEDFETIGLAWKGIAINFERWGEYEKSVEAYDKARKAYQEDDFEEQAAQTLLDIGNIYSSRINDYGKALSFYRRALEEFEELEDEEATLRIKIDIGNAYNRLGKSRKAIALLRSVMNDLDAEDNQMSWIRSSQGLADGYYLAGQNSRASEENDRTLDAIEDIEGEGKRIRRQIQADNLQAMILARMGRYNDAFDVFKRSLEATKKWRLLSLRSMLLNNYGYWSREAGETQRSLELLEKALEIDTKLAVKKDIAFDQRNLAISALVFGNYGRAKDLLQSSLQTSEELNIPYNLIYCNFALAEIYKRTGEYDEALKFFESARKKSQEMGQLGFLWKAYAGAAIVHEAKLKSSEAGVPRRTDGEGDANAKAPDNAENAENADSALPGGDGLAAIASYKKAVAAIENRPLGLRSDSSVTHMVSEIGTQEVYIRLIRLLANSNKSEEAWSYHERARRRLFLDQIGSQRISFPSPELQSRFDENMERVDRIEALSTQLSMELSKGLGRGDQANSPQADALKKQLSLEEKSLGMSGKGEGNHHFQEFLPRHRGQINALQSALPKDTVVLDYRIVLDGILTWVVSKREVTLVKTSLKPDTLRSLVMDFQEFIKNYSSTDYVGGRLYDVLIEPVKEHLGSAKSLVVIPDGVISQVPFSVLGRDGHHLVEDFRISYLDSVSSGIRTLSNFRELEDRRKLRIFAFANPTREDKADLPFAEKEIDAIRRYFPRMTHYKGKRASLETLNTSTRDYDIYHFAAHGETNLSSPADSKIFLAGSDDESELDVSEVFALNLKGDLVTLSSCNSGLEITRDGVEIVGLNKALGFSGVNGVLSSLWRIDDTTSAVVMKRFYRYYADGKTKAEALRLSQINARRFFKHPAYWAGFKLTGF